MSVFEIEADWERLDRGTPEERACFAAIGMKFNNVWLTRAEDSFVGRLRDKPHLSGYKLAEWLAWNWWRLRWEPFNRRAGWRMAHRLATIGGGYVWPNVTFQSDGQRIIALAKPTLLHPSEPLRYVEDYIGVLPAGSFVDAVDLFVGKVLGQLHQEKLTHTNLELIWNSVTEERSDPAMAARRRLEALMGFDPDEGSSSQIESLVGDGTVLGERAVDEVAAGKELLSAKEFQDLADTDGFSASPRDAAQLPSSVRLPAFDEAPWKRGAEAARALREMTKLGAAPISNQRLAEMAGVEDRALTQTTAATGRSKTAFALDKNSAESRVVLHSKWRTGRRFELARLLGDRIAYHSGEKLLPVTHSFTYRQKLQRSFAAELLCPFEPLLEMLHDDFSADAIEDAAEHYDVSEQTIRTALVNHKLLPRDDLAEFDHIQAA